MLSAVSLSVTVCMRASTTSVLQHFFSNLGTIMLFAVFGTLVSTFIVGYLTYLGGVMGLISVDTSNPMELLMFGALISAVDPVATLSIMGSAEIKCDPLLYRYPTKLLCIVHEQIELSAARCHITAAMLSITRSSEIRCNLPLYTQQKPPQNNTEQHSFSVVSSVTLHSPWCYVSNLMELLIFGLLI